jgi:hypothetical protein
MPSTNIWLGIIVHWRKHRRIGLWETSIPAKHRTHIGISPAVASEAAAFQGTGRQLLGPAARAAPG